MANAGKVLGKLDVQRPGPRLVTSRLSTAGARAADLLSDLSVATPAELRDRYRPAPGHFTLAEVGCSLSLKPDQWMKKNSSIYINC